MNPEVLDLWSRATRALRTADRLVDEDPDAAASRAYYAAFYAISALLVQEGQVLHKHSAVERAVHRDLVRDGRWPVEAGAAFSWLVNLRYTGDYGGGSHVQIEDASAAVEKAGFLLAQVQKDLPGLPEAES